MQRGPGFLHWHWEIVLVKTNGIKSTKWSCSMDWIYGRMWWPERISAKKKKYAWESTSVFSFGKNFGSDKCNDLFPANDRQIIAYIKDKYTLSYISHMQKSLLIWRINIHLVIYRTCSFNPLNLKLGWTALRDPLIRVSWFTYDLYLYTSQTILS